MGLTLEQINSNETFKRVEFLKSEISFWHKKLSDHEVYKKIKTIDDLKIFMDHHVFAVWDFMSLLKALQREITCVEIPWYPSKYSKKLVRLINEIVLGEESDQLPNGDYCDHFTLYIEAMKEVGNDPSFYLDQIFSQDFSKTAPEVKSFVDFNIDLAYSKSAHKIAGAFFFGREKLIPDMFTGLLNELNKNKQNYPALKYYLERHIELDGGEHSHLASDCLNELCSENDVLFEEALEVGLKSLKLRHDLWDGVSRNIESRLN